MKNHTVNELIAASQQVAKDASSGGEARVCIDDIERNLGARSPLEMLEVTHDSEKDDVTIFCNEFEH